MEAENSIVIRPYKIGDREAIRQINYETAFLHQPHKFFDDREIVADALTKYYTDFEPASCFVADAGGQVVGYIIGTLDLAKMKRGFGSKIFWPLLWKAFCRGVFLKSKTHKFFYNCLRSFLNGEFNVPDFSRQYPSTFHINIRDGFRGQKIGSRLIVKVVQYIHEQNVIGVQFSTMSHEPTEFFVSMGFHVIYQSRRTFLKYALGHETPFNLFGMSVS